LRIAQIDYQEEGMNDGEHLDDGEDGDCSSISGEDDDRASDITETEHIVDYDDDNVSEQSPENLAETIDDQPGNYSDGWLYEETAGEEESLSRWGWDDQHRGPSKDCLMEKDLHSQGQPAGPHVRTSAITGVGLQELLELIDEKLRIQDEKLKAEKVVQSGVFNRKWRPPRTEDAGVAVEQ
jgi:hypothetical protein